MGINGLWGILGDGEVCNIADYATAHFAEHKRPLRIAVDAACWRFTNLTDEQVKAVREKEPAANPIEKVILWRALRLLKLNVQLILVDDGVKRPQKRGRRGGQLLKSEITRLQNQLLNNLRIAHHLAPGEAEAECARLQAIGVVDAVWSDDGDALMFGCTTLIRQHKVDGKAVQDHIRSLVLFAVLAGGDYAVGGLRGCGPKIAAIVAKRRLGLANALCHASQADLANWRVLLQDSLLEHGRDCAVPPTFPDFKAVRNYCKPNVSTDDQLYKLRGLKKGWDPAIDQPKLRFILRERFHFSTREYLKHIMPIFLTRRLARLRPEHADAQRLENLALGIRLKRARKQKTQKGLPLKAEGKITFSPLDLSEVDLSIMPNGEDWTRFAGKDGTPYDPLADLECEILRCFLENGLPQGALEEEQPASKPAKNRRKASGEDELEDLSTTKKRGKSSVGSDPNPPVGKPGSSSLHGDVCGNSAKKPKKPAGKKSASGIASKADEGSDGQPVRKRQKKAKALEQPTSAAKPLSQPPSGFKVPRQLSPSLMPARAVTRPAIIDMCDSDSESDGGAAARSLPSTEPIRPLGPDPGSHPLLPGESISPATLRELRAASSLLQTAPAVLPPKSAQHHEVIDLT